MEWTSDQGRIDWDALSELYRVAPLGDKKPEDLKRAFTNSMYKCFAFEEGILAGAGRALARGVDCSYICDIAVRPRFQGRGVGKEIATRLRDLSRGHRKIVLYANPGTEPFYESSAAGPCSRRWPSSATRKPRSAKA